jgi:hypothetical protein
MTHLAHRALVVAGVNENPKPNHRGTERHLRWHLSQGIIANPRIRPKQKSAWYFIDIPEDEQTPGGSIMQLPSHSGKNKPSTDESGRRNHAP